MLANETLIGGQYAIVRLIGSGGMGAVYEAIDQRRGRRVALKQMTMSGSRLEQAFAHEARLLAALNHPNLPTVYAYFSDPHGHFLVMEYIPGDDLHEAMQKRGTPFSVDQVLLWADQLLDVLDYLHTQTEPIIHRDIKPANIKYTAEGTPILLDFGLSKKITPTRPSDAARSVSGYTPDFAPLEQIQGSDTDARSDLYSLAATLYYALTANQPPAALSRAAAIQQGNPDPLQPVDVLNPHVPRHVNDALLQALAIKPDDRPPDAHNLRALLCDPTSRPTPTMPLTPAPAMASAQPLPPSHADRPQNRASVPRVTMPLRTASPPAHVILLGLIWRGMQMQRLLLVGIGGGVVLGALFLLMTSLFRLSLTLPVQAQRNAEKAALTALYYATDGPNWTIDSGWLQDDDVCNWYGVHCGIATDDGVTLAEDDLTQTLCELLFPHEYAICLDIRLTGLNLSNNHLRGSIPPELGNLTDLRQLDLRANQLSGRIPPEVGRLTNLQYLNLQENQLSGSIPPEVGRLPNLQYFVVNDNQLSGSIPPELGNLTNLQVLNLSNNQLDGNIPPELGTLASLQYLALEGNQLSGSIPPKLANRNVLNQHDTNTTATTMIRTDCAAQTDVPPAECEALLVLYNATDGPRWVQNSGWGQNDAVCSWHGVTCTNGHVTQLNLSNNQLNGSIPPELATLTNVRLSDSQFRHLRLNDNQLDTNVADPALLAWLDARDPNWREQHAP